MYRIRETNCFLPQSELVLFGYTEGVTHDYVRHGTTTLFTALGVATGEVIAKCQHRHRHQEFLRFLLHIDSQVPASLDVHLIHDNYATHKHPKARTVSSSINA